MVTEVTWLWWFSHLTITDSLWPTDCNPPGSSPKGILQAKMLKGVAIFFSRASCWSRNGTQVSYIAGRFFTNWAMRESYLNIIKVKQGKPTANLFTSEKPKAFPLRSGTRQRYSFSPLLFNIGLEVLDTAIREEKKRKKKESELEKKK